MDEGFHLHPARWAGDRVGHRFAGQHAFVHFCHLAAKSKFVMMSRWAGNLKADFIKDKTFSGEAQK